LDGLKFIVKNTFVCAIGAEALEPLSPRRSRAKTFDIASFSFGLADASAAAGADQGAQDEPPARASVAERAFDLKGSATLADEVRRLGPDHARVVAAGLRGLASEASRSLHARAVVLALIRALDAEAAAFIPEELAGEGRRTASNIHGHVVLCALLRHWPGHPAVAALVDEVLADSSSVCCHKYGHIVAMEVLAYGLTSQRALILASLAGHVQRFARHRFGSKVLERALEQRAAPPAAHERLAAELVRFPGSLVTLACHCFGTHVVRTLLALPGTGFEVSQALLRSEQRLQKDRYGAKILQEAVGAGALLARVACGGA